jgi:integrase
MPRCLVDLGLRSSEVVGLRLDYIDYRAGTVRLAKPKSRRVDVLPLPCETGRAITSYLVSERPQTSTEPCSSAMSRHTTSQPHRRVAAVAIEGDASAAHTEWRFRVPCAIQRPRRGAATLAVFTGCLPTP